LLVWIVLCLFTFMPKASFTGGDSTGLAIETRAKLDWLSSRSDILLDSSFILLKISWSSCCLKGDTGGDYFCSSYTTDFLGCTLMESLTNEALLSSAGRSESITSQELLLRGVLIISILTGAISEDEGGYPEGRFSD